jgi:hypothetical protein
MTASAGSVRVRENGADALVVSAYDYAGRRSGLTSGGTASSYGYDPVGRLQSLTHNLAGPSADQVIGLAYNPASQIASRSGSNDGYAWTGAVAANRPYAVNGLNQYGSAGASTFAYDPNGNLAAGTGGNENTLGHNDRRNCRISCVLARWIGIRKHGGVDRCQCGVVLSPRRICSLPASWARAGQGSGGVGWRRDAPGRVRHDRRARLREIAYAG